MLLLALGCACLAESRAATPPAPSADQLLKRASLAIYGDFASSRRLAAQLDKIRDQLTPRQRLELDLIEAHQQDIEGHQKEAIRRYTAIVDRNGDRDIKVKAWVALSGLQVRRRNYIQAYTINNTLLGMLPKVADPATRREVLTSIYTVLTDQHQFDKALKYATQLQSLATTKAQLCKAQVLRLQVQLYADGFTTSTQDSYDHAVATCNAASLPGYPNGLRLDLASNMIISGRPRQALRFLNTIKPYIARASSRRHLASLHVTRAQAYLAEHDNTAATREANAALALSDPNGFSWIMQAAYEVLYQTQSNTGRYRAAFENYRKYVAQHDAAMADAKAQTLAYQIVKQDVLANKMKLDELAKQNRILQLSQSLDRKSAETNRLYALLLLILVFSIALWAYRTKHSQMRFRHMARHDDLTNAFNRQHFFETAEGLLRRLQKTHEHACLMILDMDYFKRINDRFGHVLGDTVLQHVASTCRGELRDSDVFGRLGGEEFGILMPGCSVGQGREVGQRICQVLNRTPVAMDGEHSVTVTASIGMACTRECGYVVTQLMIHADAALYEAKRGGRNQLIVSAGHTEPASA